MDYMLKLTLIMPLVICSWLCFNLQSYHFSTSFQSLPALAICLWPHPYLAISSFYPICCSHPVPCCTNAPMLLVAPSLWGEEKVCEGRTGGLFSRDLPLFLILFSIVCLPSKTQLWKREWNFQFKVMYCPVALDHKEKEAPISRLLFLQLSSTTLSLRDCNRNRPTFFS